MNKREIRTNINQYKSAIREINSAINMEDSVTDNLSKAKKEVGSAIGGQSGSNILNRISKAITESNQVKEELRRTSRNINSEINILETEYENQKD